MVVQIRKMMTLNFGGKPEILYSQPCFIRVQYGYFAFVSKPDKSRYINLQRKTLEANFKMEGEKL